MRQYVALVNGVYNFQTQANVLIADRYPHSTFTIFDVHSLVSKPLCLSFSMTF